MILSAPPHQFKFAGQSCRAFGLDLRQSVTYNFNSLGWRSHHEYTDPSNKIIAIGNSMVFGMAVQETERWSGLLESDLGQPVWNFGIGHLVHSNMQYLRIMNSILCLGRPRHIILQVNNLDRVEFGDTWDYAENLGLGEAYVMQQFNDFWKLWNEMIKDVPCTYLYWDNHRHDLPAEFTDRLTIYNMPRLDRAHPDLELTFGPKSHRLMYTAIRKQFQ